MCCGRTTTNQTSVWVLTMPNGSPVPGETHKSLPAARAALTKVQREPRVREDTNPFTEARTVTRACYNRGRHSQCCHGPVGENESQSSEDFPMPDFPVVPEDLSGLSQDELSGLLGQIQEASQSFAAMDGSEYTEESIEQADTLVRFSDQIKAEVTKRIDLADRGAAAAAAAASLATLVPAQTTADPGEAPVEEPEPVAVVAAKTTAKAPSVADLKRNTAPEKVAEDFGFKASMVAAADVPGFSTGQTLDNWAQASQAMENRFQAYNSRSDSIQHKGTAVNNTIAVRNANQAPSDGNRMQTRIDHALKSYTRHGGIKLKREAPKSLHLDSHSGSRTMDVLEFAAKESRVEGGSLLKSMTKDVTGGKSLVAAAGWCAPSETIYDLCEQETMDGILALPEVTADRGGFQIPIDGGTDFSTIFTTIGNAGDTHLTEAEVIADTLKICTEIPCPPFENVRLGVDYVCLTGGLLQRRGYPEVIGRFTRGALVALAHKINAGKIAAIVAGSTDAGTVVPCDTGDDAGSALLAAVEIAIVDMQYRARMSMSQSMEVVLPYFALAQIRAAMARRRGVLAMGVTDAEIASWFAVRNAVPRFVYDWQDAFSGVPTGPGGATPATSLPETADFVVYPAGTWVAAVAQVVDLDTIYDSTLLTANQYTAAFVEDGWAMMQMCPLSRVYTVSLDPCGCLCDGPSSP